MTRLYKVSEAAEQLNVSRNFVYKLIASGTLKCVRFGSTIRVPAQEIQNLIDSSYELMKVD